MDGLDASIRGSGARLGEYTVAACAHVLCSYSNQPHHLAASCAELQHAFVFTHCCIGRYFGYGSASGTIPRAEAGPPPHVANSVRRGKRWPQLEHIRAATLCSGPSALGMFSTTNGKLVASGNTVGVSAGASGSLTGVGHHGRSTLGPLATSSSRPRCQRRCACWI